MWGQQYWAAQQRRRMLQVVTCVRCLKQMSHDRHFGMQATADKMCGRLCDAWRSWLVGLNKGAGPVGHVGVPVADAAVPSRNVHVSPAQVWQALLSVRSLVLPPSQDVHTYLKFSSLCRKSGRVRCVFSLVAPELVHTAVRDGVRCASRSSMCVQWQYAVLQQLLHQGRGRTSSPL
jgi:FAT domain